MERNPRVAIARRVANAIPLLEYVPFQFHFDFTDTTTGEIVLTVDRQRAIRDRYIVNVPDPRLDYRIAAAMAVGLDIFQGR